MLLWPAAENMVLLRKVSVIFTVQKILLFFSFNLREIYASIFDK